MSHTIRNEKTKGWLDKLALQRRTRKVLRDLKADEIQFDLISDDHWIPSAEI
tara:strand:- start:108 stop:263 length:156 start_codon:yes stop_codon:yes gene_type:complete